jgi:hypothetical protein
MCIRKAVVALMISTLVWSAPAMAQQRHVADPSAMRQAIADQAAKDQQNRDALLGALHRSDVRDVAATLGLSVTSAENAVATLDSAELANLAATVTAVDAGLAGGANTIIISTTTLLLIVIIIILIAR